ncbi:histidine phosphatase family protein [Pseudomonas fluvialis]|jgi:alpha-ribazole phosphatase|uniref:Histidine phosphatase family protein n=1 Tax=Pseudomonas fluvialis TaxID=1793966 RepID=A0A2I0CT47_9PSED|nr:alpha-ribazole phosphatase family protein [Pseudomonas pharmacofabricae]PKF72504.1 histidine phosphatase family protein [Pseudomonas pharmacofabricae]
MTLHLDLLRHGETQAGPGFIGSTDTPLSERGLQQMRAAVAEGGPWDLLISSPLSRCQAFASELAERLGVPLRIEEDLREICFGEWEGRNAAQILLEDPKGLEGFWNDPLHYTPPQAEALPAFIQRVETAVTRLADELAGQRVLLITHGGVMRLLLARLQGLPQAQLMQVEVGYGALHSLRVDAALNLEQA